MFFTAALIALAFGSFCAYLGATDWYADTKKEFAWRNLAADTAITTGAFCTVVTALRALF